MSRDRRLEEPGLQLRRRRDLGERSWGWPTGGGMSRATSPLPGVCEREIAGGGGGGKSSFVGAVVIEMVLLVSNVIVGAAACC